MKINLDYKIEIEVKEGNKTKEKLSIFLREFTKAEKKEHEEIKDKFSKIFKKANKISKKQTVLSKKAELNEMSGEYQKSLFYIEKVEKLDDELDELISELDEIGGGNQDAFTEKVAKERFETLVSGKDVEKLKKYAEIKGYASLMRELDLAKSELEKKQLGE